MVSPLKVAVWSVVINLVIWIALVGGPGDFYEVKGRTRRNLPVCLPLCSPPKFFFYSRPSFVTSVAQRAARNLSVAVRAHPADGTVADFHPWNCCVLLCVEGVGADVAGRLALATSQCVAAYWRKD